MKTAAVICEYNPLHGGHRRMLRSIAEKAGGEAAILCLMSGDFVQRGEPAIYDKYRRAEEAVKAGADLVLELPYPWSSSVADRFAGGAISILDALHTVDTLFFGSEEKDAAALRVIAGRLSDEGFLSAMTALRKEHKELSHPQLRDLCYKKLFGEDTALRPNEILGACYIAAAEKRKMNIGFEALPILEGYSASELRERLYAGKKKGLARMCNGERTILSMLTLGNGKDRFSAKAPECVTLDELFAEVRTKSDTDARLKRELLSVLLSSDGAEKEEPRFTVLLAANGKGRALLSELRKTSGIPIVTKQARRPDGPEAERQYELYIRAQRFWQTFADEPRKANDLWEKKPYMDDV